MFPGIASSRGQSSVSSTECGFLQAQSLSVSSNTSAGEFGKWAVGVGAMRRGERPLGTLCPLSKKSCQIVYPSGYMLFLYNRNLQDGFIRGKTTRNLKPSALLQTCPEHFYILNWFLAEKCGGGKSIPISFSAQGISILVYAEVNNQTSTDL